MNFFEEACAEIESREAEREKAVKAFLSAVTKAKKAAAAGDLRALRKSREEKAATAAACQRATESSHSDRSDYMEMLGADYDKEVEHAAREAGLRVDRLHGHLIVASRILRVFPERQAVRIHSCPN